MLVVEGLVKRFGGFKAVNNVSFKLAKGKCFTNRFLGTYCP